MKKEALEIAQGLLDNELDEFNHNPPNYVAALGWSKLKQKQAKNLSGKISLDSKDYQNLAEITESILEYDSEATSEHIAENNTVSDYLCNKIAEKILDALK